MVNWVTVEKKRCRDQRRVVHKRIGASARHSNAAGVHTSTKVKQLRSSSAPQALPLLKDHSNPSVTFSFLKEPCLQTEM